MKISFACLYTGSNFFIVQNDITEVVVTVEWGPGSSGNPVYGTVTIRDKTTQLDSSAKGEAKDATGGVGGDILSVFGTVINFSSISFGGETGYLQNCFYKEYPQFPVKPQNAMSFSANGTVSIAQ